MNIIHRTREMKLIDMECGISWEFIGYGGFYEGQSDLNDFT
jgi:hypothetical protein